jgi:hypothetical protein
LLSLFVSFSVLLIFPCISFLSLLSPRPVAAQGATDRPPRASIASTSLVKWSCLP